MAKKHLWILIVIMIFGSACSNTEPVQVSETVEKEAEKEVDPPLFQAVYDKDIVKIKELVKNDSESINDLYKGRTALHASIYRFDIEVIKVLVENGADFTIKSDRGTSPFFEAADMAFIDAIYYFLDKGANPNELDSEGNTPIMMFTMRGGIPADIFLGVLDRVIEAGADLTIKNHKGDTFYSNVKYMVEDRDTLKEIEKRLPASMIKK